MRPKHRRSSGGSRQAGRASRHPAAALRRLAAAGVQSHQATTGAEGMGEVNVVVYNNARTAFPHVTHGICDCKAASPREHMLAAAVFRSGPKPWRNAAAAV